MRTLYLTRHAKSDWADARLDDHDRPLNDRGQRDAPVMAKRFVSRGEAVDLLVSSTALRAITTARVFAGTMGLSGEAIKQDRSIYLAPETSLLLLVTRLPDTAQRVMLFGHNPGFSELAESLGEKHFGEIPTCATVRIDLAVDHWTEVGRGTGTVAWFDYPKA